MMNMSKNMTPEESAKLKKQQRMVWVVAFGIPIVFVAIMVWSRFGNSNNSIDSMAPTSDFGVTSNSGFEKNKPASTDSSQEKGAIKSIYEGTYEGKFNYQYNPTCPERELSDGTSIPDGTGWIPRTLTMRVKLSANPYTEVRPSQVYVLNIWVDDPDFGTGPNGIAPIDPQGKNEPASMTMVLLPRDPSDPLRRAIYEDPRTHERTILEDDLPNITFRIPISADNLADQSNGIWIYGANGGREGYYISEDGSILHSTHVSDTSSYKSYNYELDDTWDATDRTGNGPLSTEYNLKSGGCPTRFTSWSLTKISH
jgi:hypothetical protein